jgi:Ca2+-binding RTX toxin-like protein
MRKRAILLMATTMALAVFAFGGVALADVIVCTLSDCIGTPRNDEITGTPNSNSIDALAGEDLVKGMGDSDTIHGRSGVDEIYGDGANDPANDAGDTLFGERGGDYLEGEGSINTYFGGRGPDTIDADFSQTNSNIPADGEEISGGGGNDEIFADDGFVDNIHCGGGTKDVVFYDQFDVVFDDCELLSGPG